MTHGYIDSAALMNVIESYSSYHNLKPRYKSYENWNNWTRKSIYEVTMLLIVDSFNITSYSERRFRASEPHGESYRCYDHAIESLHNININDFKSQEPLKYGRDEFTEDEFIQWLNILEPNEILHIIEKTEKESSYVDWITQAIEEAWVDHSIRNKGLFNYGQIGILAKAFGESKKKMEELWTKTKSKSQVTLWSEGADHNDDFYLAKDAYIASAILRGLFHERNAYLNDLPCQHHPIRQHVLSHPIRNEMAPLRKSGSRHNLTDPMKYLISIIVTTPWKEEKQINRVSLWANNIDKVLSAYRLNKLDHRFFEHSELDDAAARKLAVDTAKNLKLRIYPKYQEDYLDYGIILFTGSLGCIINQPWLGPAVTAFEIASRYLENENKLSKRFLEKVTLRDKPLDELAKEQAGHIELNFPNKEF